MINAMIDEDLFMGIPRMKVVWEPRIIIDKRGLFNSLFISDIDLADGEGQRSFGVEVDQGPLKM